MQWRNHITLTRYGLVARALSLGEKDIYDHWHRITIHEHMVDATYG